MNCMGSWWDRKVATRIIRKGGRVPGLLSAREQILPLVEGDVFELGCGDGINMTLLNPARIRSYSAVDPSRELLETARQVAAAQPYPCDIRKGQGEDIPFGDASFDTILIAFTLCSVAHPPRVFEELYRILKPGGRILYAEHGLSPDPRVQKWQRRVDLLSTRLLGNCHMSREITASFQRAGFETQCLGAKYADDLPHYAGWLEWGVALKQ